MELVAQHPEIFRRRKLVSESTHKRDREALDVEHVVHRWLRRSIELHVFLFAVVVHLELLSDDLLGEVMDLLEGCSGREVTKEGLEAGCTNKLGVRVSEQAKPELAMASQTGESVCNLVVDLGLREEARA